MKNIKSDFTTQEKRVQDELDEILGDKRPTVDFTSNTLDKLKEISYDLTVKINSLALKSLDLRYTSQLDLADDLDKVIEGLQDTVNQILKITT